VLFFPQDPELRQERTAKTDEKNRGRHEIRELVTRPIEPAELGILGAAQVARLDRHRTEQDQRSDTQLWLTTSRPIEALPPLAFNQARRQEWGIENGLHYVLDVSGDEDKRLRVRTLNSLCVLTLLNRVSVAVWKKTRAERETYYDWREDRKARPASLLRILCASP
jgi:predicted transposase YbfD/YdcC